MDNRRRLDEDQWDRFMEVLWGAANTQSEILEAVKRLNHKGNILTNEQAKAIRRAHDALVEHQIEQCPNDGLVMCVILTEEEKKGHMQEHHMFSDEVYDLEDAFPYLFD